MKKISKLTEKKGAFFLSLYPLWVREGRVLCDKLTLLNVSLFLACKNFFF